MKGTRYTGTSKEGWRGCRESRREGTEGGGTRKMSGMRRHNGCEEKEEYFLVSDSGTQVASLLRTGELNGGQSLKGTKGI